MNLKKTVSAILALCIIIAALPAAADVTGEIITSGSFVSDELIYIPGENQPAGATQQTLEASDYDDFEAPALFGRGALSALENSDDLLFVYDAIAEGAGDMQPSIVISDENHKITISDLYDVFEAYRHDHPHHFWINGGYSYSYNGNFATEIKPNYNITKEEKAEKEQLFNAESEEILDSCEITAEMSEYDRAKAIHDRLAEIILYDLTALDMHDAYGAIVDHTAVCDGYAKAYQHLLQRVGIESFVITGESINPSTQTMEGHAWNLVKIDGKYYQTDLTWDDQFGDIFYTYFNVPDSVMNTNHVADKHIFSLPECSSTDASYPYVTITSEGDIEKVAEQLKTGAFARVYLTEGTVTELWEWFSNRENYSKIATQAKLSGNLFIGNSYLGNEVHLKFSDTISSVSLLTDVNYRITPEAGKSIPRVTQRNFIISSFSDYEISEIHWKKKKNGTWVTTSDKTFDYNTEYGIELVFRIKEDIRKSFYSTETGVFNVNWNGKTEQLEAKGLYTGMLKIVHAFPVTEKEGISAEMEYSAEENSVVITTKYTGKFTVMLIDYDGTKLKNIRTEQVEFTASEPTEINLTEIFPDTDRVILLESTGTLTPLCEAEDIKQ